MPPLSILACQHQFIPVSFANHNEYSQATTAGQRGKRGIGYANKPGAIFAIDMPSRKSNN
jgi:hypothetical protein